MDNKNAKYLEYQSQRSDLLFERQGVQRRIESNRQHRHELEDDLRTAIAHRKPTDKIKKSIIDLDQDYNFLQLEAEAYLNIDEDSILNESKKAAIDEQKYQLIGYREDFQSLEHEFTALRDKWMSLVEQAATIRHESIACQQRLYEVAGTRTYFSAAGESVNTIKGHERGVIFLDNEKIAKMFEKKGH